MPNTLILSANAIPGLGGQGLNLYHMVLGLREHFDIRLICGEQFPGVKTEVIPPSALSAYMSRVPVLRRLRDWQARFSDVHFDSYASRKLPPANLFQGVSGQCYRSLEAAKSLGCR